MKTKTKALALVLCAVLLVVTTVFVTVAFLTSTTEVVTNTFTAGEVKITLDEAKVDEYGVEVAGADRVTANTYKLIPGHSYTKDPTVHVDANSENCYVFVKVSNGLKDIVAATTIEDQMIANGWTCIDTTNGIWVYNWVVDADNTNGSDLKVFDTFTVTDNAVVSNYTNAQITVTAYAVQADGFTSAEAAWGATFGNN